MDQTPNTAEPQKPRRRWFQFRLRTLLIGVALLGIACSYVAHEAKIVADGKAALASHSRFIILYSFVDQPDLTKVTSPIKQWLGDVPVAYMVVSSEIPTTVFKRIREAFPEAEIEVRR